MERDGVFNFAKEQYNYELSERDKQNDISIIISSISLLIVGLSYPYSSIIMTFKSGNCWLFSFFLVFYLISIYQFIRVIECLLKHQSTVKYEFIPTPNQIQKYYEEYKKYCIEDKIVDSDEDAVKLSSKKVEDLLMERYAICTEINAKNNGLKDIYMRSLKMRFIFSVAALVISYPLYCCDKMDSIYQVKVVTFKGDYYDYKTTRKLIASNS
ncbi:MAG: hypothetical protein QG673_1666 [Pseudomonadota bacterium]|nr:hypothetical protein [Pseudomonadota bacterium]